MRATSYVLIVAGLGLFGYGIYSGIRAAGDDDTVSQMGNATWAVTGCVLGAVLLIAAKRMWRAAPVRVAAARAIAGFGQVTATRDTGVTRDNATMVLEATINVIAPGVEPFGTTIPIRLARTQWGAVQPGTNVPIVVDRTDHTQVAFDPTRPLVAGT